jgi:RHS repeat-associated protein
VPISTGGGSFVLTVADQEAMPLAGVRAYLFNGSGAYLGENGDTDNHGQVAFTPADGTYKIRADYLGYPYWTENFNVPGANEIGLTIEHRQAQVLGQTTFAGSSSPITGAKVYLFSADNSYLNLQSQTDQLGQAYFYLPQQEYIARLDYFGGQYFSEAFSTEDPVITVEEGQVAVHLSGGGSPLSNVPVYVYSAADSYLGLQNSTDIAGTTVFQLPVGLYKFRADYQAKKFWAGAQSVAGLVSEVELQTGGGTLAVTVRAGDATILAEVPCYLFNSTGTYLGQSGQTDENGLVSFDVSNGSYKIRVNYLGYEYWSDLITAPETLAASVLIDHYDVATTVNKITGATEPIPGIRCYLFTETGNYTGIFADSDADGRAHFSVPLNPYKVRADYLGKKYWSEVFNALDSTIDIPHGDLELTVAKAGNNLAGVKVYLFSEAGTYLGYNGVTDDSGQVVFTVPEAAYQLRIDYNSTQYWTEVINVLAFQNNQLEFSLDESGANLTNNPYPVRNDGEAPPYSPQLAAVGDLTGLLAQSTVQDGPSTEARTFYYISDHIGTSQLIVDSAGVVVWQGNYAPFGQVDVVINELENSFRFPGQVLDSESGLYYNWHRFYDPETGRYISADPIGLAGGINLYAYTENDPINWIDPEGLSPDAGLLETYAAVAAYGAVTAWAASPQGQAALAEASAGIEKVYTICKNDFIVKVAILKYTAHVVFQKIEKKCDGCEDASDEKNLPNQGLVDAGVEGSPKVDAGKQGKHVIDHNNEVEGKSKWQEGENGVKETQEAWVNGEVVRPDGSVRIGKASDGRTIKVHQDTKGNIHGYPFY